MNIELRSNEDPSRKEDVERRTKTVALAQNLAVALADTYQTLLITQNYHWNVEGRMFHQLHELFETQYREMFMAVDEIAERLRAIGFYAPGSLDEFKLIATVEPAAAVNDAEMMVENLVRLHDAVIANFKRVAHLAAEIEDIGTEDIATARVVEHEKMVWMLRSIIGGQARMHTRPN